MLFCRWCVQRCPLGFELPGDRLQNPSREKNGGFSSLLSSIGNQETEVYKRRLSSISHAALTPCVQAAPHTADPSKESGMFELKALMQQGTQILTWRLQPMPPGTPAWRTEAEHQGAGWPHRPLSLQTQPRREPRSSSCQKWVFSDR